MRSGPAAAGRRAPVPRREQLRTINDALVDVFRRLLDGLSTRELAPQPELAADVVAEIRGAVAAGERSGGSARDRAVDVRPLRVAAERREAYVRAFDARAAAV